MTRVSKYFVDRQMRIEIDDAFRWLVSSLKNDKLVALFIKDFFTEEERLMLSKRLFIGYLVAKGLDYLEITSILKVSTATVKQAKDWLERRQGYREIIKMLVKRQKQIEFDEKLEKFLRKIFPQTKADWGRFRGTSDFPDRF